MVLMRAMCGGWHRGEVLDWDDARLLEAVRAELRPALGVTAAPAFVHLTRWHKAIPQYQVGHLDTVGWVDRGWNDTRDCTSAATPTAASR